MTDELETPHIVWATWGEDEEYPLDIAFELEDSAEHRKESQVEDLEVVPLVRADHFAQKMEELNEELRLIQSQFFDAAGKSEDYNDGYEDALHEFGKEIFQELERLRDELDLEE